MNRKLCYIIALGAAVALSSCGKKLGQFSSDNFTVNPNPLEVVGENVPATITASVPAKFFVKDAQVDVTPVLVYNGTEKKSTTYTFQGEKVRGNNTVVSYENGATLSIPANFVYEDAMAQSDLELDFVVTQGSKQYVLPRVKVATGVISTAAIATAATVAPAAATDAFQRIINEKYAADIMFLINRANVRAEQLNSDAMVELRRQIAEASAAPNREIKELNISSYASPDGGVKFNTKLAAEREKNTNKVLNAQLEEDKIAEFGQLTSQFTAQDWEGFQRLVQQSNIQDKDLIISVLSMYKDPEQREKEIRNLSNVFEQLADEILPQLRYSRITASIDVIGKSNEELSKLAVENPSELTVEELLYAGTLTNDNATKMKIYKAATKQYGNDYRTWNNLGLTQYAAGQYSDAEASFKKAASLNSKSTEVAMNLGLIELTKGNYSKAKQQFGSAAGEEGLNDALGAYFLKTGDNAAAARAFGNSKTNNAALAQILTKDYSKAKQTLAGVANPDATTYYLTAVLGARTNNEQMVATNLKKAISLDSSLADKAKTDLEFANVNLANIL